MTFDVGQKVVCVDSTRKDGAPPLPLRSGQVYTIDGPCKRHAVDGGVFVCEVRADETRRWCACFDMRRFRPAVGQKARASTGASPGMTILRQILNTKQRALALCGEGVSAMPEATSNFERGEGR